MKYDILETSEESLTIDVVGGQINSSRNKNITKKGVRLFEGQKIYTTSFVGKISDQEILKKAQGTKTVGINYDYDIPTFENMKMVDEESLKDPLYKIQETLELTQERLARYSNEFVFNGKFERSYYNTSLKNEAGSILSRSGGGSSWYYLFKKVGSANLFDGYFEESGRILDLEDVLDKNIPYLEAYNNLLTFQNGKYPVLFVDGAKISKLTESLRADKYCEGSALYSGKLNEKILSKDFSLFDINYLPEKGILRKFDEEGVVRKIAKLPLIENGVLKNVIADLRNAKKYGVEATGNGRRSFDSPVGLGFNGLLIGKGSRSTQEILKGLNECVVVFMASGGDFTDKGDYSTPLQLAYLVKKGEIVGRLPQLTVKTTTEDMFNSRLIEIASDGFQKDKLNPSVFTEMDVYLN
ncbi:MAG: hypothetical protein K2Q18_03915 [Bdellovibrionales bacterium]|nr:hypothetical protein [Bdellovibrionales bacterium]